jgi:hypothetical protein
MNTAPALLFILTADGFLPNGSGITVPLLNVFHVRYVGCKAFAVH